jgi:hypothetical protein
MTSKRVAARPRFTVIATIDPEERGRRTLTSVQRQVFEDFETVAIIRGPADRAEALGREFGCHVIPSSDSVPAARNLAFEQARGQLVAFIGPADVWHPNYLSYHARLYDLYPQALFGFTNYYRHSQSGSGPVAQGFSESDAPNALVQMLIDPFVQTLSSVAAPLASIQAVHGFNRSAPARPDLDLLIRLLAGPGDRKRLACLDRPAINLPQIGLMAEDLAEGPVDIRVPSPERERFLDHVFSYPFMKPFERYRSAGSELER